MPDISVVIPCWNAAGSIGRALRSVLDDPGVDLECIVVDDASTDGTADAVAAIASGDPRVVLVRQPANGGVSMARNAALERFRGEWLTFLDADDRFLPGGLGAMWRAGTVAGGAPAGAAAGAAAGDAAPLAVVAQQVWSNGRRTWIGPLYDNPDIRRPRRTSIAAAPGLLYHASPHAKLFHRSLVGGLRFEGRVLGDQPWVIRALLRAGTHIEVVDDVVYEWIRVPPSRRGSGGSITATTRASVARGVEAAGVAGAAHAAVTAEAAQTLADAAAAGRVSAAYAERLLRSDLGQHLARALDRRDPEIARLFGAIERFMTRLPPGTLASSDALARDIVLPPLQRWPRVVAPARPAFWSLAAAAVGAEPDLANHAGSAIAQAALRRAMRPRAGASRSAAIAALMGLRIVAAPRQLPRAAAALRRRT